MFAGNVLLKVTQNSTVSHDRRTKLKTKKQELSLDTQKLMVWARKKWKAVTSLIETELASSVTLHVGDGECQISMVAVVVRPLLNCYSFMFYSFL